MITFEQRFDRRRMFQYVNDEPSVLHCHHYTTLFTKLALDQAALGGPRLLAESAEEAFFLVLSKYFVRYEVTAHAERTSVAEEYSALVGMGALHLKVTTDGGTAVMPHTHLDEGWLQKWGKHDEAINFIGRGYIAAACSTIFDQPLHTYSVEETASIVSGDPESTFRITRKETAV